MSHATRSQAYAGHGVVSFTISAAVSLMVVRFPERWFVHKRFGVGNEAIGPCSVEILYHIDILLPSFMSNQLWIALGGPKAVKVDSAE
ncbi:hypothetical protein L1049_010465 [Liquidambar formosana]|uniref:Uncharacterized protein n=1 Tax=Liquidambar formosana TaxID=63359 RepID=A0AAP0N9W0_LIQFO